MAASNKWSNVLMIIILVALLLPAGGGWMTQAQVPPPPTDSQAGQTPADNQVATSNPPGPLPEDCDDVTPPGEDPPACCAYGYVYYGGAPVAGATVHIESLYGALGDC